MPAMLIDRKMSVYKDTGSEMLVGPAVVPRRRHRQEKNSIQMLGKVKVVGFFYNKVSV